MMFFGILKYLKAKSPSQGFLQDSLVNIACFDESLKSLLTLLYPTLESMPGKMLQPVERMVL